MDCIEVKKLNQLLERHDELDADVDSIQLIVGNTETNTVEIMENAKSEAAKMTLLFNETFTDADSPGSTQVKGTGSADLRLVSSVSSSGYVASAYKTLFDVTGKVKINALSITMMVDPNIYQKAGKCYVRLKLSEKEYIFAFYATRPRASSSASNGGTVKIVIGSDGDYECPLPNNTVLGNGSASGSFNKTYTWNIRNGLLCEKGAKLEVDFEYDSSSLSSDELSCSASWDYELLD